MKRALSIALSILLVLCMMVSCGDKRPVGENGATDDSDSTQSDVLSQDSDETAGGVNENGESGSSDNSADDGNKGNDSDSDKTEDEGSNKESDKVSDTDSEEDDEYKDTRKKITFGSYPQSEVTDATLKATLTSKAGTLPTKANAQKWTSYKYYHKYKEGDVDKAERDFMWYIDVVEGTEKYRGVYFSAYRPTYVLRSSADTTSYQDDNGYLKGTVYWFKYEPISWTVLNENTTDGTSLILCDMIVDCMQFDYDSLSSKPQYDNNYSKSSVRKWLNETFLATAFGTDEQAKIVASDVDNSVISTGHMVNPNVCADTEDKIFLLSYAEAVNDQYGLGMSEFRIKKSTAYAKAQGIYCEKDGTSAWWLRSPAPDPLVFDKSNMTVRGVTGTGAVDSYINANYTYRGVVPALRVKL